MASRTASPIVIGEHPALVNAAVEVDDYGPGLQQLVADMLYACRTEGGVGLAATQLGDRRRVVLYTYDRYVNVVVNPVVETSGPVEVAYEGCLSLPTLDVPVSRPCRARVTGFDRNGIPVSFTAEGFGARVVQHEQDHLDGILSIDRAVEGGHWSVERREAALRTLLSLQR